MDIANIPIRNGLHVVLQIFRIRNDDGAVEMVLRIRCFLMLIIYAGMKDRLYPMVSQPLHMAMGNLCRIAFGFRRDGFHAQLIDFAAGKGR